MFCPRPVGGAHKVTALIHPPRVFLDVFCVLFSSACWLSVISTLHGVVLGLKEVFASLISVDYEVGSQKHVKTHKIPAILIATPGIDNSHIYFKCYVFYTFLLMLWLARSVWIGAVLQRRPVMQLSHYTWSVTVSLPL